MKRDLNWQRKLRIADKFDPISLNGASFSDGSLVLESLVLAPGDHIYVLGDPVSEPFNIGRIMEFQPAAQVEDSLVLVNWFYRASDIHRKNAFSRELFLTTHAATRPIREIYGKVSVEYRKDIADHDKYIDSPSNFYFDKFWDRYITKIYDVVPTTEITNMPHNVLVLLQQRYKYLVLEPSYTAKLTAEPNLCVNCQLWCSPDDSVACPVCENYFHKACLDHSDGDTWVCPNCKAVSPQNTSSITKDEVDANRHLVPQVRVLDDLCKSNSLSAEQEKQLKLWPFRYLGINSNIREIIEVNNRIYPRATSRVGPQYQANITDWPGRPVQYYRIIQHDRRKRGPKPKNPEKPKGVEFDPPDLDRSLPWVQEAPPGYIERGVDASSTLLWRNTPGSDEFLKLCAPYAVNVSVDPSSCNFIDACLEAYMDCHGDSTKALERVALLNKKSLKEPVLNRREVNLFEEAIKEYGNSLHEVYKKVKTKPAADIVRFYYLWKKTERGKKVWDNCQARPSRRKVSQIDQEFAFKIADPTDPVCCYSAEEIKQVGKSLECKFCKTTASQKWRKAPGVKVSSEDKVVKALCARCARLWVRYAVVWIIPTKVMTLLGQKNKALLEPELVQDAKAILAENEKLSLKRKKGNGTDSPRKRRTKKEVEEEHHEQEEEEEVDIDEHAENERELTPEDEDDLKLDVSMRPNYCVVCHDLDPALEQLYCKNCSMLVHAKCYGFVDPVDPKREWLCDVCENDREPTCSTIYECEVCTLRPPHYSQWTNGTAKDTSQCVDAYKRTFDGKWGHVRCAIFTPGFFFNNVRTLQPIEHYGRGAETTCVLCGNSSVNCVQCVICGISYHVGCAGGKGFRIGFWFNENQQGRTIWRGKRGDLEQFIACATHDQNEMQKIDAIPISEHDGDHTVLQLYVESYKQPISPGVTGARRRVMLEHMWDSAPIENQDLLLPTQLPQNFDPFAYLVSQNQNYVCAKCKKGVSPYWFTQDSEVLCFRCRWNESSEIATEKLSQSIMHGMVNVFDKAVGVPTFPRTRAGWAVPQSSNNSGAVTPQPTNGSIHSGEGVTDTNSQHVEDAQKAS